MNETANPCESNTHTHTNNFLSENLNTIVLGDSYKLIKEIPDKSIDLIYTDIPYLIIHR